MRFGGSEMPVFNGKRRTTVDGVKQIQFQVYVRYYMYIKED